MTTIYRIQDKDGLGPWKPGLSHLWVQDREDLRNLPPWFMEFDRNQIIRFIYRNRKLKFGSGCRTMEQLRRWFTEPEYFTLQILGYRSVSMEVDRIMAESEIQLVFMRRLSLKQNVEPINLY